MLINVEKSTFATFAKKEYNIINPRLFVTTKPSRDHF